MFFAWTWFLTTDEWIVATLQRALGRAQEILASPLVSLGGNPLTLGLILQLLLILGLAVLLSLSTRRILANQVLKRLGVSAGPRESIAAITSYATGTIFCILILRAVGINLTSLAVLAGSLGIGIGFGLQDLTRNFISGLTLLLEQKIKVGDFVEWEGLSGYVDDVSLRATVIRTITGRYIIVPNSILVGNRVINWTFHDTKGWVSLPVSVPHESDPVSVIEILMDSAYLEDTVSFERPPEVYLVGFSPNAIDFQLWVWVHQIDRKYITESSLRFIVYQNLRQHGIRLAAPRMDVWQRNPNIILPSSTEEYDTHATLQTPEIRQSDALIRPISTRDLLRDIPYFEDCSDLMLKKLVELGYRRHLSTGEILYKAGDPGDAFYIILRGALTYQMPGTEKTVVLRAGQFIGEFSLMLDVPRTVTVTALEETTIFAMSPQGFRKLLQDQPHLYDLIVREMGRHKLELGDQKRLLNKMGVNDFAEYERNPVIWIRRRLEELLGLR